MEPIQIEDAKNCEEIQSCPKCGSDLVWVGGKLEEGVMLKVRTDEEDKKSPNSSYGLEVLSSRTARDEGDSAELIITDVECQACGTVIFNRQREGDHRLEI